MYTYGRHSHVFQSNSHGSSLYYVIFLCKGEIIFYIRVAVSKADLSEWDAIYTHKAVGLSFKTLDRGKAANRLFVARNHAAMADDYMQRRCMRVIHIHAARTVYMFLYAAPGKVGKGL